MKIINLSKYGAVLTGREFGMDVMKSLKAELEFPITLDFSEVEVLGSSFGDEIIPAIANQQGKKISVKNANNEVTATLKDIAIDSQITIDVV